MAGCETDVIEYTPRGRQVVVHCGDWRNGMVLCEACEAKAERQFPQGWRYYPGDVCKHGQYVGGSGIDWMCGACEMGL